jgi:hypothetical protein
MGTKKFNLALSLPKAMEVGDERGNEKSHNATFWKETRY